MMTEQDKHLDVKPGNIPVSHTSRPTISVGSSTKQDPMMTGLTDNVENSKRAEVHKEKTLNPLSLSKINQDSDIAPSSIVEKNNEPELPENVIESKTVSSTSRVDEKVAELIASKKYNLPISETSSKKMVHLLTIAVGLFILIGIAFGMLIVFSK